MGRFRDLVTTSLYKKTKIFFSLLILCSTCFAAFPESASAACVEPDQNYGQVTSSVTIAEAGRYRVWSRLKGEGSGLGYRLEVGDSCYDVGGVNLASNAWAWVDYQNEDVNNKIDVDLTAGQHTVRMIGLGDQIAIDMLLFVPGGLCEPVNLGDCEAEVLQGDVNGDSNVNVFDLSIVLVNWTRSGANYSQGDLNGDGVVNVFDLSMLLMNWGRTL